MGVLANTIIMNIADEEIEMVIDSCTSCNIVNNVARDCLRSSGGRFKESNCRTHLTARLRAE